MSHDKALYKSTDTLLLLYFAESGTGIRTMLHCGWKGNRRSVSLVPHRRLRGIPILRLRKINEEYGYHLLLPYKQDKCAARHSGTDVDGLIELTETSVEYFCLVAVRHQAVNGLFQSASQIIVDCQS